MSPIRSKVAGTTAKNPNGTQRQRIIRNYCTTGQPLTLRREPNNTFDENAIAVYTRTDTGTAQIGYINADLAEKLAPRMNARESLTAHIIEVTGGTKDKKSLGVNIEIRGNTIARNNDDPEEAAKVNDALRNLSNSKTQAAKNDQKATTSRGLILSRPLIFALQLGGLIMLISGASSEPKDGFTIGLGILLVIVGGIGYRNRKR